MSSSGIRAERDLVHLFWEAGFAVLRAPASGGGTVLPRPDLIAGSVIRKKFFVLEIKTTKKDTIYLDDLQIDNLIEFASRIGFQPFIGVKFKDHNKGYLFLEVPSQLETTGKKIKYKITYGYAIKSGKSFNELIGDYEQKRLI